MALRYPCQLVSSAVLITLLACLGRRTGACDLPIGYTRPTTVQKVLRATYVLYGRVQRTFRDPQFDDVGSADVYTAQMEVYCTLKGPKVAKTFNISQAGQVPGHCSSTQLIAAQEYFVLLNNQFLPHGLDFDEINGTEEETREVTKACGLMRLYPHGVSEATAIKPCPQVASDSECLSETKISNNDNDTYIFSQAVRNDYGRSRSEVTVYSSLVLVTAGVVSLVIINVSMTRLIRIV